MSFSRSLRVIDWPATRWVTVSKKPSTCITLGVGHASSTAATVSAL